MRSAPVARLRMERAAHEHQIVSYHPQPQPCLGLSLRAKRVSAQGFERSKPTAVWALFFEDAIAEKRDMVGKMNDGWTVGKRLLQHERSTHGGLTGNMQGVAMKVETLADTARRYLGETDGRIADRRCG